MSEPVAWLIPGCITRDKELAEVNKAYAEPLYLNPDPRIAELEAVLRECRKELNGVLNGKYSGNADRAIAKISGTSAARRGGSSPFLDTSDSR